VRRVVVVGAGLAGVRAVAELRQRGYEGHIVLLSAEEEQPYDRPPLSKAVLAGGEPERLDPEWYAGAEMWLGVRATGLRPAELDTTAGVVPYDGLVLACGAEPITLPGSATTLRTLGDAVRLRSRLRAGERVVLVGASWIGAEVATAAARAGCEVTVLEAGAAPLAVTLGVQVGKHVAPWYAAAGVRLRVGTAVTAVGEGGVTLAGGERLAADTVLVGIGVRAATGWLAGSGIALDRGVLTDVCGRTSLPGVVAVGDCAVRWSPRAGRYLRAEHWDDALHSPATAVAALLGDHGTWPRDRTAAPADLPAGADPVPYVWSEQFDRFLQWSGWRDSPEPTLFRGDPTEPSGWSAAWLSPAGVLTGFFAADRHRDNSQARRLIAACHKPDPARLADESTPLRNT
jgi:3-phenylpropionate/trans-cinnamate dioxygenase ferredoxin reductase component